MLTPEQKKQFSELLEELGQTLDITKSQYDAAVSSYQAVGSQLSKEGSFLAPYKPEILPQGSFLLGTMVKPTNDNDDLDIDLVCKLTGKQSSWTQYDLKQKVGDQLKENELYRNMLKQEGRRCWTLVYADSANYHMDILPSIVDVGYQMILENAFSTKEIGDLSKLAIRITDKEKDDYHYEQDHRMWLKSNPFGYGKWFSIQASLGFRKTFILNESVKPVPQYQKEKLPLQRVVQILKRHRDLMFNGDEDKPISIIITTLAARAYKKETSILDALLNVVGHMPNLIEEKYNPLTGKMIKWVSNPINEEENFADKWEDEPQKEINFYKWIEAVQKDIRHALNQESRGLQWVLEALKNPFGEEAVTRAFSNYGDKQLLLRENGGMKMAGVSGTIGSTGRTSIPKHTNFGATED